MSDTDTRAVGGPLDGKVRPRAWIGPVGQTMPDEIYAAWAPLYPDDARHFLPMYGQAELDSAVAVERERIKARLLGMDDAAAGRHNYYAHAAWVLFDRKA